MYKPISDYGIIGNCRSCALVSSNGSIDFACFPDFDSNAQFCAILDENKGGFFQITPVGFYKNHQNYLENTNILKTNFFNQHGSVSLTDFMPMSIKQEKDHESPEFGTKVVRLVRAVKGDHQFELKLKVTPNFALEKVAIDNKKGFIAVKDSKNQFVLYKKHHIVKIEDNLIIVSFFLKEGEQEFFSLDFQSIETEPTVLTSEEHNAYLAKFYFQTIRYWQTWVEKCTYHGQFYDQIIRSALTLKMLTYSPTGAIIAAATTSLPEKIGDSLNWDYRFTWLRDASFTVYAFLGLGYLQEAEDFMNWLERVCLKEGSVLKIMYGIHGEEELTEKKLDHLSGYMGSKPVRIGNGAAGQKQFDIFGEVLIAIGLYLDAGGKVSTALEKFLCMLVDYCCTHWSEPDAGIWEIRYGEKQNTYSKLMCWAGIDRGIKIAKHLKTKTADLIAWEKTREEIKKDILEKGFNKEIGAFTAFYGSKVLDTSILNISKVGFLPANDPRVLSTLDKVMQDLVIDWFVLRTSDTENKLQEGEGTFFISTFWLVDCLALLGRVDEAKVWLNKIIHDSSPLGLYAEEFDPITKKHLGNFPQAFTHLGLINAVLNIRQAEQFGYEQKPVTEAERLSKIINILVPGKSLKHLLHIS